MGGACAGPTLVKMAKMPKAPDRAFNSRLQMNVFSFKVGCSPPYNRIRFDECDSDNWVKILIFLIMIKLVLPALLMIKELNF